MATLVLTAVGSALGGPIGAALGAMAGQAIDARLFAPKARHGARLSDLAVQTSSYGTPMPRLFGTMRVAGTVIWATDLVESRSRSGGGKGRPKTVTYSYSASFAVGLSARRILDIGRIWADGKLLRGSAGDFKTQTRFRFYTGDEEQAADPLIASAEGGDGTPAYRGLAYAVFEGFELADYGNRIPSLSFEVVADEAPVSISAIAAELAGGTLLAGEAPGVAGYLASGDTVRGAIEDIAAFVPLSLIDEGATLRIGIPEPSASEIEPLGAGTQAGSDRRGRDEQARRAASAVASSVTLGYADPERDHQPGLQRAFRGAPALLDERRVLPIAVTAGEAKRLAEARLAAIWAGRSTASLNLTSKYVALRPGTILRVAERTGLWRVERWTFERMIVRLQLVAIPDLQAAPGGVASSGRPVTEADLRHGPTSLRLVELPSTGGQVAAGPRLFAAAAGAEPGWRRAALIASFDGGASWQELGDTAAPAVMGQADAALPGGSSALLDTSAAITVTLLSEAMLLENRSDTDLANGANLALLGDELIQFGAAEPIGAGRYRLSRLLRGRLGTEWACADHQPAEPFLLIEQSALAPIEAPSSTVGGALRVTAAGREDGPEGGTASKIITGEALRPPSPVHLHVKRFGGDVQIAWTRRSRSGWPWLDGTDAPLGEESERYELVLSGPALRRVVVIDAQAYTYTESKQQADGATGPITAAVAQLGTYARSRPATVTFII